MDLKVITGAEKPEVNEMIHEMLDENCSKFMYLCSPETVATHEKAFEYFPDCRFIVTDGLNSVACACAVPLLWNGSLSNLPDEGWEWAVKTSRIQYQQGIKPNLLCPTEVAVDKPYRGKGISSLVVQQIIAIAERKGFDKVIVPVRPSNKYKHLRVDMGQYMTWKREDGYLYDPWLRVHEKLGAEILKPCRNSMVHTGSVKQWEEMTGMTFDKTGEYELPPDADSLVKIDIEQDVGIYIQQNVWVAHHLKQPV